MGSHKNTILECVETGRQGSDTRIRAGEYVQVIKHCWTQGTVDSMSAAAHIAYGRAQAMRSDNIESVWLNHVSQSVIGDESVGAREFKGMRTICTSGKVNRCGLVQETGLIPNSEKWLCGILHVAVLHFLKWTLEGESELYLGVCKSDLCLH